MIHRKTLVLFVLLGLLAATAFAGGRSDEGADGETTVTLGYNSFLSSTFTDTPAPIDVMRAALEDRYPNITLEYETMSQDLLDQLVIWMTSQDTTVDIFGIDEPWVSQFGRAGWAVPLNDRIPDLENRFSASGLDTFSYQGDRLGIPFWGSVTGLYYRTDILEEYDLDPPESIDDMVRIIETVQASEPDTTGLIWPGAREESIVMFYSTLLHSFGGGYLDGDEYDFDSPESLAAVRFMRSTVESGISPTAVQNWEREEGRQRFVSGDGIFLWDNNDIVIWLDDPERSEIAGNWDLMPFPAQPGGREVAVTGGFAFGANPFGEKLEAASQVLDVIAGERVQKGFALAWGPVQYYDGLYDDPEVQGYNPNVDKLIPLLDRALNRPPSESYAELSGILQEQLNAAITGVTGAESALESINSRANALRN